jgi:hypothetical protein
MRRRRWTGIGLAAACATVIFAAGGTAAAAGNGASATGGSHLVAHDVFGLQTLELQNFGFNAKVRGDGSADGWFNYRDVEDGAPFTANGPVTCLTVIGNDAWVGATIHDSNDPTVVGLGAWWHVTDNGEGPNAPADVTTFLGVGSLDATTAFCATHPAYRFPFAIDGGNVQVRA